MKRVRKEAQLRLYSTTNKSNVLVEVYDKPLRTGNLGLSKRESMAIKDLPKYLEKLNKRRVIYPYSHLDSTFAHDPRIEKITKKFPL